MCMNNAGEMIISRWKELQNKFINIKIDDFVVMPNHFHGIIQIVGADLCVRPQLNQPGRHAGRPLHQMIQWFKTMTTNEYIKKVKRGDCKPFYQKLWQRNYYEHVVRDEEDLDRAREYIFQNPGRWDEEKEGGFKTVRHLPDVRNF